MENQTKLKWYQKPIGVAILLIIFWPVGLYQVWKNQLWTNKTMWITAVVSGAMIIAIGSNIFSDKGSSSCSISGIGFHLNNTIAIKFNSDGRFTYSDKLMNQPKSFWGTWNKVGDQIITTNDRSTTGMGIGQKNTYTYDCDKLYLGGFTLVKD